MKFTKIYRYSIWDTIKCNWIVLINKYIDFLCSCLPFSNPFICDNMNFFFFFLTQIVWCNLPPVFTEDMNNLALSEATPVGYSVYKLEGFDPEGGDVTFGLVGSDNFMVDAKTGDVKVIKALDREVCY